MGPKIDRSIYFILLAIANAVGIWFILSTLSAVVVWVYVVLIAGALIEDGLILGWSIGALPDHGITSENSVAGIWVVGQTLQFLALIISVGLLSVPMAVLVVVLSAVWIQWRASALNRLMDFRYW